MKKIALTIAAVASLGLAACGGGADDAAVNDTNTIDLGTTGNEAEVDVNAANADAANLTLDDAATAIDNGVDATGNAVSNAADATTNAL